MNTWTAFFFVLSVVAVASPFFLVRDTRPLRAPEAEVEDDRVGQLLWALDELEADAAARKIGEDDHRRLREELEKKLSELRGDAAARTGDGDGGLPQG